MSEPQAKMLEMVDQMPAFPASVQRILAMTSNANVAPKDLVQVIDHDPVLTMRILKVVNSAYYGLSQPIVSVKHAVVYIGINTIKHLALGIAAIGTMPRENEAGFLTRAFLLHSVTTAVISRRLTESLRAGAAVTADAFVAGLIHDIGQVVFAHFLPEKYQRVLALTKQENVPLHVAERDILGADHAELGGLLAEKWKLPPELVEAIRYHHHEPDEHADAPVRNSIYLANVLSDRLEPTPFSPVALPDPPSHVLSRYGKTVEELLEEMSALEEEFESARTFVER
jgi:putative nucleotidyltransferase with HDIG domain